MKKSRLRSRDISFLFFVSASLILMVVSVKNPSMNRSFQAYMVEYLTPFAMFASAPGELGADVADYTKKYIAAVDENQHLQQEKVRLEKFKGEALKLRLENEELRALMSMGKEVKGDSIATRLILDGGSPFTRSAIALVGKNQGVERGQQVVNNKGLVGRVVDVFDDYSRVLYMTDYTFRAPVWVLETRTQGLVRGTNDRLMELMLIEEDSDIQNNMTVVTSGAGGVFSENIPIGYTFKENGKIYVVPEVNFARLSLVSIERRNVKGILQDADIK